MTHYVFESLNPTTAAALTAADSLTFSTPGLAGPNIAAAIDAGMLTITAAGRALAFPMAAIDAASAAGNVSLASGVELRFGGSGGDQLSGGAGDDIVWSFAGDDRIDAGSGNDFVFGGMGSDTVIGGDGNDHIYGSGFAQSAGQDVGDSLMGGNGDDYVQGNAGNDTIDAGAGNDRVQGGADQDLIYGRAGNDSLNGNLGNDTIDGGEGADTLRGGQGRDVLIGGDGNDVLMGDRHADVLTGGAGQDVFRFAAGDALLIDSDLALGQMERITDFTAGEDRLQLGFSPASVLDGGVTLTVALAQTKAVAMLAASVVDHAVVSVGVGSDTYLFYSGVGTAIPDSVIRLDGASHGVIDLGVFI